MKITFITLFPDPMSTFFKKGIIGKAQDKGLIEPTFLDLRQFADPPHNKVDDYPFGGKTGMLLKADVLYRAISSIEKFESQRIIYTCPKGTPFCHDLAKAASTSGDMIIICGYYEGLDDRIFDLLTIERWSLGDFVLTSGEIAAMAMAETIFRLVPGVIGNPDCVEADSVISGRLEYPQYTSPRDVHGMSVPDVVTSGHHAKIQEWREAQSVKETFYKKPSLFIQHPASKKESILLGELLKETSK